jgi:Right handed beta helix region
MKITSNATPVILRRIMCLALSLIAMAALALKGQAAQGEVPPFSAAFTTEFDSSVIFPLSTLQASDQQSLNSTGHHTKHVGHSCPAPTRAQGHKQCVLDADAVLTDTLALESDTTLNCRGFKLMPSVVGVADKTNTPTNEYVPSSPEIGVMILRAYGVEVRNCVIEDFDWGIALIDAKIDQNHSASKRNKIVQNTIHGKYNGIFMAQVDEVLVRENVIRYGLDSRGKGIQVYRDADRNQFVDNDIRYSSTFAAETTLPLIPGGELLTGAGRIRPSAIEFHVLPNAVLNFIINDELVQLPNLLNADGSDLGTANDENLVKGNFVNVPAAAPMLGRALIGGAGHNSPKFIENTIGEADQGLHFSGLEPTIESISFAGTCSGDSSRYCGADADCFIPAVDTSSKGVCTGAQTRFDLTVATSDAVVKRNSFVGPMLYGIVITRPSFRQTVIGNTFTGISAAGITVRDMALETTTLRENVVSGTGYDLLLQTTPGSPDATSGHFFGADIRLNDFTSTKGVATGGCGSNPMRQCTTNAECGADTCIELLPFAAELSGHDKGNYWGRTCSDSDGFRAHDEPGALGATDTTSANVMDSHPFGAPVAKQHPRPATCL